MILPVNAPEGQMSITHIIKNNPNKRTVKEIKDYADKMRMHNTGKNFDKYIAKLDYFESERLIKLRQKYAPNNVDVTGRLHRPLDKVYTAKGGGNTYKLPPNERAEFIKRLADVKDGDSLRHWMQKYWFEPVNYDPMGLIFMEIDIYGNAYPTYKASETVFDYPLPKGRKFDYIVFDVTEQRNVMSLLPPVNNVTTTKYFRVIDDAKDYMVRWDGQSVTVIQDETYDNWWGEVPAITLGWMYDNSKKWYVSPDHAIENALDQYMRERSVVTMFRMHHGFPLKWQLAMDCPTCKGTGRTSGDNCQSCNGSGLKSKNDVAETIYVKPPRNKEQPYLKDVAGYVVPPVDSLKAMEENVDAMYKDMHFTRWGTHQVEDSSHETTATGRFIDVQPVNDSLIGFSQAAEYVESWVTDMMGRFYFEDSYKGCHINLGRRYMIETPDQILERYAKLRGEKGCSLGVLNMTYIQYLETEYQNDDEGLQIALKKFKLEPFPHMTYIEVVGLTLPEDEYKRKLYFQQWLQTKTDIELLVKDYQTLFDELTAYIEALEIEMPDPNEEPDKSGNVPAKKPKQTQYKPKVNNKSQIEQ